MVESIITYASLDIIMITGNLDGYSVNGGRTPENTC